MRCLVSGGAGFIASHVVDALIEEGHEVIIVDDLSTGKESNINKEAKFHKLDITGDIGRLLTIASGVDWVFHLAAWARLSRSVQDPIGTNWVNVNGTLNILQICRQLMVKRLVFSSTSSVYGDQGVPAMTEDMIPKPMSPYGLQKLIGDQYCELFSELYDMEIVSLRYFSIYGPRQVMTGPYALVIGKFMQQKSQGKSLTIYGDGTHTRGYCHVYDVARANLLAAKAKLDNKFEIFNIGTDREVSVNEVAEKIGGDFKHIMPHPRGNIEEERKVADYSKAQKLLGWEPLIDFDQGMEVLLKNEGSIH